MELKARSFCEFNEECDFVTYSRRAGVPFEETLRTARQEHVLAGEVCRSAQQPLEADAARLREGRPQPHGHEDPGLEPNVRNGWTVCGASGIWREKPTRLSWCVRAHVCLGETFRF